MGLIKECIETKRKEREIAHAEKLKQEALAEADRRLDIVIKTVLYVYYSSAEVSKR